MTALRLDPGVARKRFPAGATTRNCDGRCCRMGVWVDLAERDAILALASLVQAAMDEDQPHDPRTWFEADIREDGDVPSGYAAGTALPDGYCVFLNARRRCVLHIVSDDAGVPLKPFFCAAFPITVNGGIVLIDPAAERCAPGCCGSAVDGPATVLDVCPAELELVLGSAAVADLRAQLGA